MLVFYERFIEIKPLEEEIAILEITDAEKEHLHFLVGEILHHHALEAILDNLEEKDKQVFLESLGRDQPINLAQLLKDKVIDYEKILQNKLTLIRDEIIAEIRKVKKLP